MARVPHESIHLCHCIWLGITLPKDLRGDSGHTVVRIGRNLENGVEFGETSVYRPCHTRDVMEWVAVTIVNEEWSGLKGERRQTYVLGVLIHGDAFSARV